MLKVMIKINKTFMASMFKMINTIILSMTIRPGTGQRKVKVTICN